MKKITGIVKLMFASIIILNINNSTAQQNTILPNPYSEREMRAKNCNKEVYRKLHKDAEQNAAERLQVYEEHYVRKPVQTATEEAENAKNNMLKCVERATKHVNKTIAVIEALIKGVPSIDLSKLGDEVFKQLADKACTAIDRYTHGAARNVTSPINSGVTDIERNNNVGNPYK